MTQKPDLSNEIYIMETIMLKLASLFINIGMDKVGEGLKKHFNKKKLLSIEEIKKRTNVLFVDDEDLGTLLDVIRDAGWDVRQVNDITDFNSEGVKKADIIFMDYIDVGKVLTPKEEGIGLLKGIRKRYPEKFLIFMSGYAGFIPGHEFHSIVNAWIDKHADPFMYIDQIEAAARKIHDPR